MYLCVNLGVISNTANDLNFGEFHGHMIGGFHYALFKRFDFNSPAILYLHNKVSAQVVPPLAYAQSSAQLSHCRR